MNGGDFGPFTKRIYLREAVIDHMALQALNETKLMPKTPGPVDIDKFCIRKWGWEEQVVDLGPGIMGQCAFSEQGVESIDINVRLFRDKSRTGRVRVKSTKGHEIGHALAHPKLFALKLREERLQGKLFPDMPGEPPGEETIVHASREESVLRPNRKEWWEIQANMLMRALLLPTPLLREVIDGWYSKEHRGWPVISCPLDRHVAEVFDVSYQMAKIAVSDMLAAIKKENDQREATDLGGF